MIDAREAVRALQQQIARIRSENDKPMRIELHSEPYRLIMIYLGTDPEKKRLTKLFGVPICVSDKLSEDWVTVVADVTRRREAQP